MTSPTEKTLLAIDPGSEMSAWISMNYDGSVRVYGYEHNELLVGRIVANDAHLVIEDIRCYGMAVGQETLDTCKWIGEFRRANGGHAEEIPRLTVKTQLCRTARATDANVRQALIDRYGGSKQAAVGTKKKPGPLHGIGKHVWSALAVGVTFLEQRKEPPDAQ